jgi:hypothetical protein
MISKGLSALGTLGRTFKSAIIFCCQGIQRHRGSSPRRVASSCLAEEMWQRRSILDDGTSWLVLVLCSIFVRASVDYRGYKMLIAIIVLRWPELRSTL